MGREKQRAESFESLVSSCQLSTVEARVSSYGCKIAEKEKRDRRDVVSSRFLPTRRPRARVSQKTRGKTATGGRGNEDNRYIIVPRGKNLMSVNSRQVGHVRGIFYFSLRGRVRFVRAAPARDGSARWRVAVLMNLGAHVFRKPRATFAYTGHATDDSGPACRGFAKSPWPHRETRNRRLRRERGRREPLRARLRRYCYLTLDGWCQQA